MRRTIAATVIAIMIINIILPFVPVAGGRAYAAEPSKGIEYYKNLPETDKNHIPDWVPNTSKSGKPFNEKWWTNEKYHVIVYGSEKDWPETKQYYDKNERYGTMEYRYLGYDYNDNPFSNQRFPDDVDTGLHASQKNWIYQPWNVLGFEPTEYSRDKAYKPDIDRMAGSLGWSPYGKGEFFGYGNVQSYPTLTANGSMRMWHRDKVNGIYQTLYQTFTIPQKPKKEVVQAGTGTPFSVTTEILSNDFTIGEDESSITILVKVTAHLHDESIYNDPLKNVLYYNRADVDKWYIKLEYKNLKGDSAPYVTIKGDGKSNIVSNVFSVKLKRDEVVNGERIYFNGIGRVVFVDGKSLVANDTKSIVLTVLNKPNPVYPPDIYISAPSQVNVKESYQVEVVTYVPEGETMQSLVVEKSFNGGAYASLPLSGNKATESYSSEGTVNYRATITLTNGKSATATATTQIVDNRAASAKADIWLPQKETYEGHYITAYNKNRFYFDGKTYTAKEAREEGIGTSTFRFYDASAYELDRDLYDTKDRDNDTSVKVRFNEPGTYKLGCVARPKNGDEDEDIEAVIVKSCPDVKVDLLGSRKDDRKLTLDFSNTVTNPDYPLDDSKTYVVIEDTDTGEKVTVRYGSDPDTATIKTRSLKDNKLEFLIKASSERNFKATVYVEDIRGESDTDEIRFTIKPDYPPVAELSASLVQYRDSTGTAKVKIGKAGRSDDGDKLKVNNLKYKVDTDNDGNFDDETLVDLSDSLTELDAVITTDKVGKILLDYTIQEDLTPETLPEFVTENDYLSAHITKVIDVDNLAPHTALRTIGSSRVDLMFAIKKGDRAQYDAKAGSLQSGLNQIQPVSVDIDSVNEMDITATSDIRHVVNNFNDPQDYIPYTYWGDMAKSLGATNNTFFIRVYNRNARIGKIYARSFEDGKIRYTIDYDDSGYTANISMFWGDYVILSNRNGYFIMNADTGEIVKSIDRIFYKSNIFEYNGKVYHLQGQTLTEINTSDFSYTDYSLGGGVFERKDNRLYTIKSYADTAAQRMGYVLGYFDLNTKQNVTLKTVNYYESPYTYRSYYNYDVTSKWSANFTAQTAKILSDGRIIVFYEFRDRFKDGKYYYYAYRNYIDLLDTNYNPVIHKLYSENSYLRTDNYDQGLVLVPEKKIEIDRYLIVADKHYHNYDLDRLFSIDKNTLEISATSEMPNGIYLYGKIEGKEIDLSPANLKYYAETGDYFAVYESESSGGTDYNYIFLGAKELYSRRGDYYSGFLSIEEDSPVRVAFMKTIGWAGDDTSLDALVFFDARNGNTCLWKDGTWIEAGGDEGIVAHYYGDKVYVFKNSGWLVYDPKTNTIDDSHITSAFSTAWAISPDGKRVGGNYNWDGYHVYNTINVFEFSDTIAKLKEYADNFTARPNTQPYAVVIYDGNLNGTLKSDIDTAVNALKAKGLKCIWLGKSVNQTVGQAIASATGGTFMLYTDYTDAFTKLQNYIASQLPPKESKYVVNVKKGEPVGYEKYYFDIEGDKEIPSTTRWMFRHIPSKDGLASFSGQWLSSPVTVFDKDGTYYVSWDVQDNPKPADTDSRFASYRKYAVREEMVIIVGDAEPPAEQTVNPTLSIQVGGNLKQNRKVTADLYVTEGTNVINYSKTTWTYTALSGGANSDIKVKNISNTSKHLLFKKPGKYRIAATIEDVKGNKFSTYTDIDIVEDLPITGNISVTPETAVRAANGLAKVSVETQAVSSDDYIEYIKYYLVYDSDNDGDFADEVKVELLDKQNLNMFELQAADGVGLYKVLAEAKEGFKEETIPEFITDEDYSRVNLEGGFMVDNISPLYSINTDKDVYLVGEEIKYLSGFTGDLLRGEYIKGYYDEENDTMIDFKVKYTQDRYFMPKPDSVSMYHNEEKSELITTFDRAGQYTIEANAKDDPKPDDSRFSTFRKDSNTSTNTIIVHRKPVAKAEFTASHPSETHYDFGNNMYLEGTRLRVFDASYDPDGFGVTSKLEYKVGDGDYVTINAGDAITLEYGDLVTVRVSTEDNWGATDTNLYNIVVVNDLDMVPEVIPSPVPASESVTLRLTTNQYAISARAVVFGQNVPLAVVSETAGQKVWEAEYTIPAEKPDSTYTAQFYAVSEGLVELRKNKDFEVDTPINLVPYMPSEVTVGQAIKVRASTRKYASSVKVVLFKGTAYETALNLKGTPDGEIKNWSEGYTVPEDIIEGTYEAEFTARTPNGNTEVKRVNFEVSALKITGVSIQGFWNHWRGQTDIFGKRMSIEPHRFLSLERIKIDVETSGFAEKVVIRFSPELEAMSYTNELNQTYDYKEDFFGYYVEFPRDSSITTKEPKAFDSFHWEYNLPLAPSTKTWDDVRRREPYKMTVYAYKGDDCEIYEVADIEITGNIYDLTYIQPIN